MSRLDTLVSRQASLRPDAPALSDPKTELSYGQLDTLVDEAAERLTALGVQPGDRVGLYVPKNADAVVDALGILRAGAAYVPIDPQAPAPRAAFALQHAQAVGVIVRGRPQVRLRELESAPCPILSDGAPAHRTGERHPDLAYILYTSGSTGTPKGVAITHAQSLGFVTPATEAFAADASDVFCVHAPLNFDLSVIDLYCAFCAGASTFVLPETWAAFPKKIVQQLAKSKVTVWNSVPSALVMLLERGGLADAELSLRLAMFAGEAMRHDNILRLQDALPDTLFLNIYGQTEANSSLMYPVDDPAPDPLPIGQPLFPMEVFLLGDDGNVITEPDIEGELIVVSASVAQGYFRDPERSESVFIPDPRGGDKRAYRTQDRAYRDADDNFVFRGRRDRAVKVRGFRVELAEVEAVSQRLLGGSTCCLAVPHSVEGYRLVVFCSEPPPDDAKTRFAAELPHYMLPYALLQTDPWPRTGTGKTDRKALRTRALEAATEGAGADVLDRIV